MISIWRQELDTARKRVLLVLNMLSLFFPLSIFSTNLLFGSLCAQRIDMPQPKFANDYKPS